MKKVAVVTGGSSGIGLATAKVLVAAGFTVFELSRRDFASPDGITHIKADVTDFDNINIAIEKASKAGNIELLLCCAGGGISGAVEFTEEAEAKRLFDINFFGVVNSVKATLPYMRKNGSGRIIIVSSVAAALPIPFQAYYSATKSALNSYACALANEVRPFGISVCAVMPGDIRTGFTNSRKKLHTGDDVYRGRISRSVAVMERDERNGDTPETAGRFLTKIALKKKVKPLYVIGFKYRLFVILSRVLPVRLVNIIVGSLYAK